MWSAFVAASLSAARSARCCGSGCTAASIFCVAMTGTLFCGPRGFGDGRRNPGACFGRLGRRFAEPVEAGRLVRPSSDGWNWSSGPLIVSDQTSIMS